MKKPPILLVVFLALGFIFLLMFILQNKNIVVLNPMGIVASQQRDLMIRVVILMLLIVVPSVFLTFFIALRYREGNNAAKYEPERSHGRMMEVLWWAIPTMFVLVLSVVIWKDTHKLDPYKPLESSAKPLTIQVVALQWKWFFIYPEYDIATVNFIQFPSKTPLNFELTADAPMNSFWIPSLGGQMYAMTGMSTKHHLMADTQGDFEGLAAEINGKGFSRMRFVARSSSQADFDIWVQSVKDTQGALSLAEYKKLSKPSEDDRVAFYSTIEKDLYNEIIMKYMEHTTPIVHGKNHE